MPKGKSPLAEHDTLTEFSVVVPILMDANIDECCSMYVLSRVTLLI